MIKVTKMKIPELKRELKEYDQKELIRLIAELYKLNKDVQHYLSVKFNNEDTLTDLYEKTRKEVKDEFFPDRGYVRLRLGKARKAIMDFKRVTKDHEKALDLMVFYVELGTKYTSTYGDIDEKYYDSMESMFYKVVIECEKDEQIFNKLQDRLYAVVVESNGVWEGYHENLEELYNSICWLEEEG